MSNAAPDSLTVFTTFGELLKHLRRQARLTQRDLALAVGYSEAHITRLENGQRLPDVTVVHSQFVTALGLDKDPQVASRLLALAAAAHTPVPPPEAERPVVPQSRERPLAHNLPAPLTRFIGRQQHIAEVLHLIASHRLVTLTGAGGVGKTRLALEVGAAIAGASPALALEFPDGVWLAGLAAVAEPGLAPGVLARVFGLVSASRAAQEILIDHLRHRRLLLILDNCEHLIQACAELAEALLQACPALQILATSREGLNIPGELTWRVPSLALEEAARLFEERARAVNPQFMVTNRDAAAVARVCERLDGIPLAIELAAARVRSLTVGQIEGRLNDAIHLLTTGSRTALPRHQTLRALIDWSYNLLPAPERVLLRRLSVFAGGWTLDAAEAVTARARTGDAPPHPLRPPSPEADAVDIPALLDQLVGKSLVSVEQGGHEPRYRMLEVVRQYAHEELVQAGEYGPTRDRHLAYVVELTGRPRPEEMSSSRLNDWYDRVQDEIGNVRAALEWARQSGDWRTGTRLVGNLVGFWTSRGYEVEGLRWATAILSGSGSVEDPHTAYQAHRILGILTYQRGDFEQALQHRDAALALAQQAGTYEMLRGALLDLIIASPDAARAYALAGELLRIARDDDQAWVSAFVDYSLARHDRLAGNFAEASRRLQAAGAYWRTVGNLDILGAVLGESGFVARDQGDLTASRTLWEQALAIFRALYNPNRCAHALVELGAVAVRQGDTTAALPMVKECLQSFYRLGTLERVGESVAVAAGAAHLRGDAGHATTLLSAADALWSRARQLALYRNDVRAEYERLLPLVRAALAPAEFEAAWAAGQGMTLDEVVATVMAL